MSLWVETTLGWRRSQWDRHYDRFLTSVRLLLKPGFLTTEYFAGRRRR